MTNTKNLIERATIITPEISFSSLDHATDFFSTRKIEARIFKGSNLTFSWFEGKAFLNVYVAGKYTSYPLRDSGMEGLLQKIGIGKNNFSMYVADDHLINYNLNYLFKNTAYDQEFTVLFEKNPNEDNYCIKSIMSGKYSHINHLDVLNIINEIKVDHEIHNIMLNKNFFRVSITNPANTAEAVVGDVSSVGIDLKNSETGYSSLTMGKFLYRDW